MGDVTSIDVARARRTHAATPAAGAPVGGERLYTTREIASRLRVSERSVRRWSADGMPSVPIGRKTRRYDLNAVLAWCAAQREGLPRTPSCA